MDQSKIEQAAIKYLNDGAQAYRNGDYQTAQKLYEKSAELGNSQALCNLGYIYAYGRVGQQDFEQAYYYFEQASLLGNANASYKLGDCYHLGQFVKQNDDIAFLYYQRAEALLDYEGDDDDIKSDIYYRLALCFFEGNGVDNNPLQALNYINQAETYSYYDRVNDKYNGEEIAQRIEHLRKKIKAFLDMPPIL